MYKMFKTKIEYFGCTSEDDIFIKWITPKLEETIIVEDAFIIQDDSYLTQIFFILKGFVSFKHLIEEKKREFFSLPRGSSFGIEDVF